MDKLRFILLFAVVLLAGSAAAYDFESGGLYYNILDADAKTVELTCQNYTDWETKSDYTGDIVVPAVVTSDGVTYNVVKIGHHAFKNSEITTLSIPEGVEIIDQDICEGCYQLTNISLPSTLKSIGYAAFWNCSSLTSLNLPEGLTTLENDVFRYCRGVKRLTLPSTLTSIGERAFANMSGLVSVISNITVPYAINENVFAITEWNSETQTDIYYPSSAALYVPVGTKALYQTTEGWTMLSGIYEGEPQEVTLSDGLIYSYITGEHVANVIGWENLDSDDLTIRSIVEINGENYSVKSVGSNAFNNCGSIISLTIENGVETIGNSAFNWCYQLKAVNLPSTITSIGNNSFSGCKLSSVILPEGVQQIGSYSFSNCNELKRVELPSTIKSIGDGAFMGVGALYAVTSYIQEPFAINKNVFALEQKWDEQEQKYYYTPSSATLYVPTGTKSNYEALDGWTMFAGIVEGELIEETIDGVIYSYNRAAKTATVVGGDFSDYRKVTILGSILIDGGDFAVKTIAAGAFRNNNYIDSLIISSGIETIEKNAFYDCYNIRYVELPSTLTTIGEYAFGYCSNIQNLILPFSLTSIGDFAFCCNNLTSLISRIQSPFDINQSVFCSRYDNYWDVTEQKYVYTYTNPRATLYVPIGTKSAYEAIEGWSIFETIFEGEPKQGTVGDFNYEFVSGSNIATLVEGDYSSMANVTIPASVTFEGTSYRVIGIANNVFSNIGSLRSVKIEEGVETLGNRLFQYCHNLRSVVLPESIKEIGDYAFSHCLELDTLSIPGKVERIGSCAFEYCKFPKLVIPANTKSIGDNAFRWCSRLTSIVVDPANQYYDSRNNCNALIEKSSNKLLRGSLSSFVPNTVVEVGEYSFNALSISGVSIPNSVTSIGHAAFAECNNLTTIYIPSRVTSIGSEAFAWCTSLSSIVVDPNNSVFDSRNNCNAIIETGSNRLLVGCAKTAIPRDIKIIGFTAFRGSYDLDSLKIPSGVEEIETFAFSDNKMQYIEIPNSVRTIGYYAFGACRDLVTIVSKIKAPSEMNLDYGAFYDCDAFYSSTLYVPKGKAELYSSATNNWSGFVNIQEMDGPQLSTPILSYDGRSVTAATSDSDVDIYYSTDGSSPNMCYNGPIAVHDLGVVKVVAEKSFYSDSEEASYEVKYLYDGDTLKLAEAGLMAEAIKWCGTDSVVKMTVVGPISTDEFSTISTLPKLKFLNLADAKVDGASLPDGAFANSQIVSFVSPSSLSSVGSGIFRDCQHLAAVCWKASTALPADALSGVSNPNLLLYVDSEDQAPEGINNVVVDGKAKSITLTDATGNSNFYVPVAFQVTDTIKYTRNFQQKTEPGVSCGWETIVLPFTVNKITHETMSNVTITPFANYRGWEEQRPFWLYTLDNNDIRPAYGIEANVPYLICMPNADEYGDQYNLAGNVTFMATNVDIAVSKPIEETQGDITFVPTYQSVPASADVFTLNVNQEYKGYPAGSLFVSNFRDVRPFEAYSIHPSAVAKKVNEARMYSVSSLIGGDGATGIIDVMLKKNDGTDSDTVVKVYSLSGALIKQGKAEDVTNGLPKGVYVANGKKFVVK